MIKKQLKIIGKSFSSIFNYCHIINHHIVSDNYYFENKFFVIN